MLQSLMKLKAAFPALLAAQTAMKKGLSYAECKAGRPSQVHVVHPYGISLAGTASCMLLALLPLCHSRRLLRGGTVS